MALIAYARVSTDDQSLDLQRADLKAAGCITFFEEKLSGKTLDRPALAECLASLGPGDVLVVTKIDRLARNTRDLLNIIHDLDARSVGFRALWQPGLDTTSVPGKLVLQIMAAVAEFEVSMTAARRDEGIARAKAEGKYVDPVHVERRALVKRFRREGQSVPSVQRALAEQGHDITIRSIYRLMAETPKELTHAL